MELNKNHLKSLIQSIDQIIRQGAELEKEYHSEVHSVHPLFRKSARNLLNYMALRNFDIRKIQMQLAELGLSSLGRCESHVLFSLNAVRNHLLRIAEEGGEEELQNFIDITESQNLLEQNTKALLGPPRDERNVRIMVTLDGQAARDYSYVKQLIDSGMNCARINCAHDSKEIWIQMIDNIKRAQKESGKECKILMDLAGLKLRTGSTTPGPRIKKIKTKRDFLGKLIGPAKIWLAPPQSTKPLDTTVHLPLSELWLANLEPGDKVYFQDKRGKKRHFLITACEPNGCRADLFKRSFVETGTQLYFKGKKKSIAPIEIGELPPKSIAIILKKGDVLLIHSAKIHGENAKYNDNGKLISPAHISCSNPEIFTHVKNNDPILFNDGKIEGIVNSASPELLVVKIVHAKPKGSKLKGDKGINLPDTDLGITGLQIKDYDDLNFVTQHADIVNLSFVNYPEDVFELQEELKKMKAEKIAVMLKIETLNGFKNLPQLLLALMKTHPVGIMIARGDLAIECGWQRLAEIQEEILWLCEAAHVPVVWATQVLEGLAKKGSPSRAEITDAAMSQRAECVMLNKGPHIIRTIETLSDILQKMDAHQYKKTAMLRHLRLSDIFNTKTS